MLSCAGSRSTRRSEVAGLFTVVDRVPARRSVVLGAATALRLLVGNVLVVASMVAFAPAMLVIAALVIAVMSGSSPDFTAIDASTVAFVGGGLALSIVFWLAGSRLVRGRRQLVVFLRRFGFTPATKALSFTVGGSVGRGWRLVTLDDHQVAPVGVRTRTRWLIRLVWLVLVVGVALLGWVAVEQLSGDSISRIADQAFDDSVAQARADGRSTFEATVGALFATVIVTMVMVVVLFLVLVVPLALGGASALFVSVGARGIRRAEQGKAVVFNDRSTVDDRARMIRRRSRKVSAPRMVVTRVDSSIWQLVVTRPRRAIASSRRRRLPILRQRRLGTRSAGESKRPLDRDRPTRSARTAAHRSKSGGRESPGPPRSALRRGLRRARDEAVQHVAAPRTPTVVRQAVLRCHGECCWRHSDPDVWNGATDASDRLDIAESEAGMVQLDPIKGSEPLLRSDGFRIPGRHQP